MKLKGDGGIEFSNFTEILVLLQFAGILYLIFAALKVSNLIFAGYFIAISLSNIDVVRRNKLLVDRIHQKLKVEDLTKYRNDYLFAFGSITMCSVVFQFVVYSAEFNWEVNIFYAQMYLITTLSIYFFFIFPTFDIACTWEDHDGLMYFLYFLIALLTFFASMFVSNPIVAEYEGIEKNTMLIYQYWCSLAIGLTFSDFLRVCWTGVRLTNVNERRNEMAAQTVEPRRVVDKISAKQEPVTVIKTVAPKPSCNICSCPYTETGIHTPRQIKECGHTICEQCVSKLLNVKCPKHLVCPFCQKVTVVNGSAGSLPKNFALLEYRRDVVQRN